MRFDRSYTRDESSGCWLWSKTALKAGYGQLWVDGKMRLAHRVSYFLATGEDPGDRMVCHRCDNPACVNPSHLFVGDGKANQQDAVRKGRHSGFLSKGEANGQSKLTEEQVRDIYHCPDSQRKIAARYGIHQVHVSAIKLNKVWQHLNLSAA